MKNSKKHAAGLGIRRVMFNVVACITALVFMIGAAGLDGEKGDVAMVITLSSMVVGGVLLIIYRRNNRG